MAGGRPTKYTKIDLKKVALLAKKGWTDSEMFEFFGVASSTWYKWKGEHEEFSETLKDWKGEADKRVERSLYERACGYSHPEEKIFNNPGEKPTVVPTTKHYAPDPTSAIFWLKNRQPSEWKDKREHELSTNPDKPMKWEVEIIRPKDIDAEDTTT